MEFYQILDTGIRIRYIPSKFDKVLDGEDQYDIGVPERSILIEDTVQYGGMWMRCHF